MEIYDRLQQIAEEKADGGDERIKYFIGIIIAFICFQIAFCWTMHKVMISYNITYRKMATTSKKIDYITRYSSIVHSFLSTYTSYLAIFHFCDKEGATMINDDECLRNPKQFHVFSALITLSYLIFDFIVMFVFIRENSYMMMETIIHHLIAISGFFLGILLKSIPLSVVIFN